jgi:L-lactate dehydrogenase complex protein LldG
MQQNNHPDQDKARDIILERLRKASAGRHVPGPERPAGSLVKVSDLPLPEAFVANLQNVSGEAAICATNQELLENISTLISQNGWNHIFCPDARISTLIKSHIPPHLFEVSLSPATEVVITGCEALVADTGSVLVSSEQTLSRQAYVYGPVHVVIASESQINPTADDALQSLLARYEKSLPSFISIITGPSRTADIEKTLILGAHGPKALHVLITRQEFYQKL